MSVSPDLRNVSSDHKSERPGSVQHVGRQPNLFESTGVMSSWHYDAIIITGILCLCLHVCFAGTWWNRRRDAAAGACYYVGDGISLGAGKFRKFKLLLVKLRLQAAAQKIKEDPPHRANSVNCCGLEMFRMFRELAS